jgi:8-oxo-dGTP pyrophosphatase MutT (NUDIX family)
MVPEATKNAAGFVLFERGAAGRRYLLLRNSRHGSWGFPKGHQDGDEDLPACARRELAEETSIVDIRVVDSFKRILRYRVRSPRGSWEKVVTYFLAEFVSGEVRLSHEHDDQLWATHAEARRMLDFDDLRRLLDEADRHPID